MCGIDDLVELHDAGVYSLKIEGRMKSVFYVATIVHAYRKAIDAYFADPENYKFNPEWMQELKKVSHREFTTGFYFDKAPNLPDEIEHCMPDYHLYDEWISWKCFERKEEAKENGIEFDMYKFRSMVVNAEELKEKLASQNEMSGPMFKMKDDPRITKVGKFIRKTSIDELPQL